MDETDGRRALALLLAQLALADGRVRPEERRALARLVGAEGVDALLADATLARRADLTAALGSEPARFVAALRATGLAFSDSHLDAREEAWLSELYAELSLSAEDQRIIMAQAADGLGAPHPRVVEMLRLAKG